jgi:hypothetical protein
MCTLGTCLNLNYNAMCDAVKISPCVRSTCAQNPILSLVTIRDRNKMGDAAITSPRVPSTSTQNEILSSLIIHTIPSQSIDLTIDNPSLVPSVSCLTTSSYLCNDVCAANNVSHAENLQSTGCRCFLTCRISRWDPSYTSFQVLW